MNDFPRPETYYEEKNNDALLAELGIRTEYPKAQQAVELPDIQDIDWSLLPEKATAQLLVTESLAFLNQPFVFYPEGIDHDARREIRKKAIDQHKELESVLLSDKFRINKLSAISGCIQMQMPLLEAYSSSSSNPRQKEILAIMKDFPDTSEFRDYDTYTTAEKKEFIGELDEILHSLIKALVKKPKSAIAGISE